MAKAFRFKKSKLISILAIVFGIIIFIQPAFLSYFVAIYLVISGIVDLLE